MEGTIYLFEVCKILRVQGLYEQIQKEFEEKGVLIPIVYAITKEAPSTPLHNQIFDNGCFATKITMSNDEKKWAVCTAVQLVDGVFNGARTAIAILLHELGHLYHQDIPETFDDLKIGAQIVDGILIDESAELRADAYAAKYGYGDELKQFLIKLVNSSNVDNQNLRHNIDNRIAALQNYKEEVCAECIYLLGGLSGLHGCYCNAYAVQSLSWVGHNAYTQVSLHPEEKIFLDVWGVGWIRIRHAFAFLHSSAVTSYAAIVLFCIHVV